MFDFRFAPTPIPSPELEACYGHGAVTEFEVIDHLGQLADALRSGSIGFEYFSALSRRELARVGW
jgi:hypothetical protein